jgi:hypothetical protein
LNVGEWFLLVLFVMLLLHFMAASRPLVEQGYHLLPCPISWGRLWLELHNENSLIAQGGLNRVPLSEDPRIKRY